MPSPIKAKNGSSLFNATLSLIKEIRVISVNPKSRKSYIVVVKEGQEVGGFSFHEMWSILNGSDMLYVNPNRLLPTLNAIATTSADTLLMQLLLRRLRKGRLLFQWSITTESIDNIRALAKEIRAEKAVARAAKKPAKPKADLKTRRDII